MKVLPKPYRQCAFDLLQHPCPQLGKTILRYKIGVDEAVIIDEEAGFEALVRRIAFKVFGGLVQIAGAVRDPFVVAVAHHCHWFAMQQAFEANPRVDGDDSVRCRNQLMHIAGTDEDVVKAFRALFDTLENLGIARVTGMRLYHNRSAAVARPLTDEPDECGNRKRRMVGLNVVSGKLKRDKDVMRRQVERQSD